MENSARAVREGEASVSDDEPEREWVSARRLRMGEREPDRECDRDSEPDRERDREREPDSETDPECECE